MFTPDGPSNKFVADFGSADPFSSSTQTSVTTQPSFANFDNNPIFNSSRKYCLWVSLILLFKEPHVQVDLKEGRSEDVFVGASVL